jgi:hypothetical protein
MADGKYLQKTEGKLQNPSGKRVATLSPSGACRCATLIAAGDVVRLE